jgi:hypothetical protein
VEILGSSELTCNRCEGKGVLIIKVGAPDPERDTHVPYEGPWYEFPPTKCPVCRGSGERRDRENQQAGWTMTVNADGWVVSKKRLPLIRGTNQGEDRWIGDGKNPP